MVPIRRLVLPRERKELAHFHSERMVGFATATVPVVTDLINTKNLALGLMGQTRVDGVGALLRSARWTNAASFGKELQVLPNTEIS